jgi:hypothetical protein
MFMPSGNPGCVLGLNSPVRVCARRLHELVQPLLHASQFFKFFNDVHILKIVMPDDAAVARFPCASAQVMA